MIVIIGAGLAGLSAALELSKKKQKFLLLDASPEVGGKLKTINWSGFNLDFGFQVLLSAYPSLAQIISAEEFTSLSPNYFDGGALIFKEGKTYTLSDPLQNPEDLFKTLFCSLITIPDKFRLLLLKQELKEYSFEEIWQNVSWTEQSALDFLKAKSFSKSFIENFAKPFFGGVFANNFLNARANCFLFCFKAFSEGRTFIPANGIQELPKMLRKKIPLEMLKLNSQVQSIQDENQKFKITLANQKYYIAEAIILATEIEQAYQVLGLDLPLSIDDLREKYFNLYFVSKISLYKDKKIFLNANPEASINHLVQISGLKEEYLISATILKSNYSIPACIQELEQLFPHAKDQISFLKAFEISGLNSLLKQDYQNYQKLQNLIEKLKMQLPKNIFLAGEYLTENCSQENSIKSGIKAATEYLETSLY